MITKDVVMVVGGGKWQVPIIKEAKRLGCVVINSNLHEDSPGFEYSDHSYVVDVLDKEKNYEIAKLHNVSAVVTDQSDIAINTVAYINERMGLNGLNIDTANLYTNKYCMRKELLVDDLYHPQYKLCRSESDALLFIKKIQFPVIIKPLDNQSSRGVYLITSTQELKGKIKSTKKYSKNGEFLVEEYVGGVEITAEGFKFNNGNHVTLAVSRKDHYNDVFGVANSLLYQINHAEFPCNKLCEINNKLFNRLPFGITHVEYKYFNGKFYLVEAAARGGGTRISSDIVPVVSGINVLNLYLKTALGLNVPSIEKIKFQNNVILGFFRFSQGVVKTINIDKSIYDENLIDMELEFSIGDSISEPVDDRSRHGYFILKNKSLDELKLRTKMILDSVTVEYI